MSQFYFASASASAVSTPAHQRSDFLSDDDDDDEIDNLPYPGELSRQDFLHPAFDAQAYLSTLSDRHQTLEDLRSDLRKRSQLLNQELLDLVNGNYEEFLGLGADLRGGDEKVEGVRVGLLGFQREINAIRTGVKDRADEVSSLLNERKRIRRDVVLGRNLLEVDEQLGELEASLGVKIGEGDMEPDEYDEDEDVDSDAASPSVLSPAVKKLHWHVQQYLLMLKMIQRTGSEHPFLVAQRTRLNEVRKTLLLDLAATLRQSKATNDRDTILLVIRLYGDLGAENESVKVLKGS